MEVDRTAAIIRCLLPRLKKNWLDSIVHDMSETLARSYSDKFVPGMSDYDLHKNKNQDWTRGRFTYIFYVIFIAFMWCLFHVTRYLLLSVPTLD